MRRIDLDSIERYVADEIMRLAWLMYRDSIIGYDRTPDPNSGKENLTFVFADDADFYGFETEVCGMISGRQASYGLCKREVSEDDPTLPKKKIPFPDLPTHPL